MTEEVHERRCMRGYFLISLAVIVALACAAQNAPAPAVQSAVEPAAAVAAASAAAPAVASAAPQTLTLPEGTPVKLKFAQKVSSKTAMEDDPVTFILAEDLLIDGVLVAKAGAFAAGSISHAKRAGMMGKPGELNVRLTHLKHGDKKIKLRGTQGKEGQGKEGTAVALTVLFGPIGLVKHGKNVEVEEGTPLVAYVDQDYIFPRPARIE